MLVVPRETSDADLVKVASHRSRARLPAVTYRYKPTGATMSRCSQPLVGIKGKRSADDELMVDRLRLANPTNSSILYFMDARPYKVGAWFCFLNPDLMRCQRCIAPHFSPHFSAHFSRFNCRCLLIEAPPTPTGCVW